MLAIFKREFKSFFTTPLGYVILIIFNLFSGFYFWFGTLYNGTVDMSYVYGGFTVIVLSAMPIITMRLFSEERRQKTDQALLTAPVSITGIVMSKFFAAFLLYIIGISVTILYSIILAFFAPNDFIPTAFDSGGVTTGPITVPFIMALGAGMASMSAAKNARENSFGLIALCSIGPILSVLLLSIVFKPESSAVQETFVVVQTTKEAFASFIDGIPHYAKEVIIALLPILGVFAVFQVFARRFNRHQILRMVVGFIYTYIGLVFFLTGANVGFMPAGRLIGARIAAGEMKYILIPIGALMGYFVVSAEPAVHTLKKQVEEITNGSVSQKSIGLALSIGVGCSVGIAMLRILTGIPVLPILIVGYIISLVITFYVSPIYTGIAFDSGGVASGPMSTTFVLPFAIGACEALGGNVMTDAFGVVAMVAMTPLIAIQVLGLLGEIKRKKMLALAKHEILKLEDDMIYYEEV